MRRLLCVFALTGTLVGCSTLINKTFQQVSLSTPGIAGADCVIETPANKYRVITPAIVQIERGDDRLDITCHKALYYDAHISVKPQRQGDILLNVANGVVLGAAVDVASKADYAYPHAIAITLQPDEAARAASQPKEEPQAEPLQRKSAPDTAFVPETPDTLPAEKTVNRSLRK